MSGTNKAISATVAAQLSHDAVERVIKRWGIYIPREFHSTQAQQIFVLHPDEQSLRRAFTPIWNDLFQRVVQSPDPAATVALPGGFVTPELDQRRRKIHVNVSAQEFDWLGLFTHEFVHWLSHPRFYPVFYKSVPGTTNDIVEGLTDYITLKCMKGYADGLTPVAMQEYLCVCAARSVPKLKKSERAAYNWAGQYTRARNWLKAAPENERAALEFVFRGVQTHLPF